MSSTTSPRAKSTSTTTIATAIAKATALKPKATPTLKTATTTKPNYVSFFSKRQLFGRKSRRRDFFGFAAGPKVAFSDADADVEAPTHPFVDVTKLPTAFDEIPISFFL